MPRNPKNKNCKGANLPAEKTATLHVRAIGMILQTGANHQGEAHRLELYFEKIREFYETYFPNRSLDDPVLGFAAERAFIALRYSLGEVRDALQSPNYPSSKTKLANIARRAEELIAKGATLYRRSDSEFCRAQKLIGTREKERHRLRILLRQAEGMSIAKTIQKKINADNRWLFDHTFIREANQQLSEELCKEVNKILSAIGEVLGDQRQRLFASEPRWKKLTTQQQEELLVKHGLQPLHRCNICKEEVLNVLRETNLEKLRKTPQELPARFNKMLDELGNCATK